MTPAERIAAARGGWGLRGPESKELALYEALLALDALCPKGESIRLDRTGDTDRLVRQRETALRGVWADIEDGPDE